MRSLWLIAAEIETLWRPQFYGAVPYLRAMGALRTIDDMYGADSAEYIVRYLLANAKTWRGPDARRIKSELTSMLKGGASKGGS